MSLFHEFRIGLRSLSKDPGFSAVAILTLTLAIGANTAIFSIVNAVLLRPLPYPEASRIVQVQEATQNFAGSISWPNLYDLRQQNTTLESVAAFTYNNLTLHAGANPERLRGQAVTSNYFHVLGLSSPAGAHVHTTRGAAGVDSGCGSQRSGVEDRLCFGGGNCRPDNHSRRRTLHRDRGYAGEHQLPIA